MVTSQFLQQRMDIFLHQTTIYPVSCEALANGRTDEQWLDEVLAGGARIVQLRDKESNDRTLYEKALVFRHKTEAAGALLIINNRLDIALAVNADGIHLGNSDMPAEAARIIAPDLIIGVSANTEEQAATAKARGASYFNIGPIYPTQTKKRLTSFLGPKAVPTFAAHCDLPFTVMGGIKFQHIKELTEVGVRRIAVVTALTQADNIAAETTRWIEEIKQTRR